MQGMSDDELENWKYNLIEHALECFDCQDMND